MIWRAIRVGQWIPARVIQWFFVFFFQAEDGIRDLTVTGVQTCALPILVGICIERSVDMLCAILGVMKAGAAYVPLDAAYPKDRLAAILEDAKAPILLTQDRKSVV